MLSIRKGGHRELERYYPLMEVDFDSKELISKPAIHKGMLNGSIELLIISEDGSGMDAAYALMLCGGMYGYVIMKYMAVMPWFRGRGVGIETMRLINRYCDGRNGIIAEISEFNDHDKLRKLGLFFTRFGYQKIHSDYSIRGVKVNLYVKPIKGTADIARVSHLIVPDIYSSFMGGWSLPNYMRIDRPTD